ncbi:MAG: hypothetical protein II824_07515 [Bacteroidales bacterium]|nr:hypothetical protein [Bacteroidales bacterium]
MVFKRLLVPMAALLITGAASCDRLILEDRTECPAFLFFDITNAENFNMADYVHVAAFLYPEETLLASDTTTVRSIQEKEFSLAVKRSESVFGYGVLGFKKSRLVNETQWVVDEGQDFDRLWRFDFRSQAMGERFYIPVEMVKDHSNITVFFEDFDMFYGTDGRFPFDIVVRSNTCGIDGLTGEPVAGSFLYRPKESPGGTFKFTVPRQFDRSLVLEVWEKGVSSDSSEYSYGGDSSEVNGNDEENGNGNEQDGGETVTPPAAPKLIASFSVWSWVHALEDFSWSDKNLSDIDIAIHLTTGEYTFNVMPWKGGDGGYYFEL